MHIIADSRINSVSSLKPVFLTGSCPLNTSSLPEADTTNCDSPLSISTVAFASHGNQITVTYSGFNIPVHLCRCRSSLICRQINAIIAEIASEFSECSIVDNVCLAFILESTLCLCYQIRFMAVDIPGKYTRRYKEHTYHHCSNQGGYSYPSCFHLFSLFIDSACREACGAL